jgi:hypothetical protein
MNKLYYILIICFLIGGLSACQHGSGNSVAPDPSALIVGKWNLQQEKFVQYVNGVTKADITELASSNSMANLEFSKDGSYHSASHLIVQGGPADPLSGGINYTAAEDSTYGTYTVANTSLNLSALITGFIIYSPASFGTTTTIPVFALISNTSQIDELSVSKLNMHTEVVYTETVNSVTTTYKNEIDSYYTK